MSLLTFLAPRFIPPGRARMLMPGGQVQTVDAVPEWYWAESVRIIARTDTRLRHDAMIYTYFTCEEEPGAFLFHTVVAESVDYSHWVLHARARTLEEAREVHEKVRAEYLGQTATPDPRSLNMPPPGECDHL